MDIVNLTNEDIKTMGQDIAYGINTVRYKYLNFTNFEILTIRP